MIPNARVVHDMQERTRFRVSSRKRDEGYFAAAQQALLGCEGVWDVQVEPLTGSILLLHDRTIQDLIDFASEEGIFEVERATLPQKPVSTALRNVYHQADGWIQERTEGAYDMKEVLLVGLIAVAAVQFLRGQFLGPGSNMLWYVAGLVAGRFADRSGK